MTTTEDTRKVSPRDTLVRLHQALTQKLLDVLSSKDGKVDAAILNVIRQLLKDNGINWETTAEEEDLIKGVRSLQQPGWLPEFDKDGNVINKDADPEKVIGFKPSKPPNPLTS